VDELLKRAMREGDLRLKDDVLGLIDLMECQRGEIDIFGEDDGSGGIFTVVESRSIRVYEHVRFNRDGVVRLIKRALAEQQQRTQSALAENTVTETSPAPTSSAPVPTPPRRSRGPARGTVGHSKSDRKFFRVLRKLLKDKSLWAACLELAPKLQGGGSEESKAKRLMKLFRKEAGETD
jgi:hypothetical protein